MVTREPWTRERAEHLVRAFYKLGPPYESYTRQVHESRRRRAPDLPTWEELRTLLDKSPVGEALVDE